ncbi:acetyl-L-homoserine sulfhydrolase [Candidatus Marinamargulisbacteria bacterium SCGC AG-414-C22]|nr:acetyl-L-homoserine sulfhydrolase [Candidatus Marinamargulisbacteria bacterium SCGC AG-414-C22]
MTNYEFETKLIHGNEAVDDQHGATVSPIYQTASYAHEEPQELSDIFNGRQFGYSYSRIANPSVTALEQHVNALENGRGCVAVSSGMAAMGVICDALFQPGDHLISSNSIFGGTYYLLQEYADNHGVAVAFVEGASTAAYEAAIQDNTKGIFVEIIGNPKCDVPHIKALSALAKKHHIPLVVDCTATTPLLFNAKEHGVDVVWYSATKWLGGGGRSLGGLIIDCGADWKQSKSPAIQKTVKEFRQLGFLARCRKLRSNKGACLAPFNAFLIQIGLETLSLRLTRQCENALALATYFDSHDEVDTVNYPGLKHCPGYKQAKAQFNVGFGGFLTIRLGSKERAFEMIRNLKLSKNLANLGDVKTIVIHPSSTIYRNLSVSEKDQAGAFDDLIRISVGIEHINDIINDFKTALEQIKGVK